MRKRLLKWLNLTEVGANFSLVMQNPPTPIDEHIVIAITDANFSRYGITPEYLQRTFDRHPKVKKAIICIGEGAEVSW